MNYPTQEPFFTAENRKDQLKAWQEELVYRFRMHLPLTKLDYALARRLYKQGVR